MERSEVEGLAGKTIVVVGDLMIDRFVYGDVDRISPEAPIPVLRYRDDLSMLGGSGNVARNIVALNGKAVLVGAVGDDPDGEYLTRTLCADTGIDGRLIQARSWPTIVKTRFVCGGHQILRVDREETQLNDDAIQQSKLAVADAVQGADAMVISDYAKGMLTPESVQAHISEADKVSIPVIVDPKSPDLAVYRNAYLITPNAKEAENATGFDCSTDDGASNAAEAILRQCGLKAVLVTRGAQGMTLLAPDAGVEAPLHLPTKASSVYDVSGAGDTVVATLALALAAGLSISLAAQLANSAAGIVVGKLGTAAVSTEELTQSITAAEERAFKTQTQAVEQVALWHRQGLKVGFANGCFDLVHPGHVSLLTKARLQCDRLVVALNSDASVKRLKGASRPVQDETSRAAVIGSLRCVDLVTLFTEDTPLELIGVLKPDVLIKGEDYKVHEVVGGDVITQWGGRVVLIPLERGHSTTNLITRSLK